MMNCRSSMVDYRSHMMYQRGHMMHQGKCMNLMGNFSRSFNNRLHNRGMGNCMSHWECKRSRKGKRSSCRSYQGSNMSSSWEVKASIEEELRISLTLMKTVKTVDRVVATGKRTSIARCRVWSV